MCARMCLWAASCRSLEVERPCVPFSKACVIWRPVPHAAPQAPTVT
eukprot:SAG25_NODE_6861_length_523_cov_1.216981_1_plen_45_part_10